MERTVAELINKREKIIKMIKAKKDILNRISNIFHKHRSEFSRMLKQHDVLDREIFERTTGITKVTVERRMSVRKVNIMADGFVDALSREQAEKLLARLQNKIEIAELKKENQI